MGATSEMEPAGPARSQIFSQSPKRVIHPASQALHQPTHHRTLYSPGLPFGV